MRSYALWNWIPACQKKKLNLGVEKSDSCSIKNSNKITLKEVFHVYNSNQNIIIIHVSLAWFSNNKDLCVDHMKLPLYSRHCRNLAYQSFAEKRGYQTFSHSKLAWYKFKGGGWFSKDRYLNFLFRVSTCLVYHCILYVYMYYFKTNLNTWFGWFWLSAINYGPTFPAAAANAKAWKNSKNLGFVGENS